VADVHFFHFGDTGDPRDIHVVQPVPRSYAQPQACRKFRCVRDLREFPLTVLFARGVRVRAGMDLDPVGARFFRRGDLPLIGVDEQADDDAGILERAGRPRS
jgi:hypothetical protein